MFRSIGGRIKVGIEVDLKLYFIVDLRKWGVGSVCRKEFRY